MSPPACSRARSTATRSKPMATRSAAAAVVLALGRPAGARAGPSSPGIVSRLTVSSSASSNASPRAAATSGSSVDTRGAEGASADGAGALEEGSGGAAEEPLGDDEPDRAAWRSATDMRRAAAVRERASAAAAAAARFAARSSSMRCVTGPTVPSPAPEDAAAGAAAEDPSVCPAPVVEGTGTEPDERPPRTTVKRCGVPSGCCCCWAPVRPPERRAPQPVCSGGARGCRHLPWRDSPPPPRPPAPVRPAPRAAAAGLQGAPSTARRCSPGRGSCAHAQRGPRQSLAGEPRGQAAAAALAAAEAGRQHGRGGARTGCRDPRVREVEVAQEAARGRVADENAQLQGRRWERSLPSLPPPRALAAHQQVQADGEVEEADDG